MSRYIVGTRNANKLSILVMTNTLFELCSEEARKEIAKSDMWQNSFSSNSVSEIESREEEIIFRPPTE